MKQKIMNKTIYIVVTLMIILGTHLITPLLLLLEGYNTIKMWAMLTRWGYFISFTTIKF